MTAVMAMLDIEHEPLKSQDSTQDNNNYVLGRMGQHNVVIACLPAGVYGTTLAATVAGNMLRTFTGLRFGLLVGIGGGIPNNRASRDIRLGDIVVSPPEGIFGGVVQYDMGKNMGEGGFRRKGFLNSPPTLLLTALSTLQSVSGLRGSKVPDHLMEMNEKHPGLESQGYVSPGRENDTLYCPQCDGSSSSGSCNFEECYNGKIPRPPRNHGNPVIHYGTIASGNQVIKDAKERDQLGREYNAVCVEMEAAGLMNNFPCIVVRGICDYADSHKNDTWQKYAAAAAAVYAKWFLGYVTPYQTANEERIQDVVGKYYYYLENGLLLRYRTTASNLIFRCFGRVGSERRDSLPEQSRSKLPSSVENEHIRGIQGF
jgi:nucleoside phosphorylase